MREAGVWAVMTAYNKVNGVYCGEQPELINGILRGEWDFDGVVMSDWYGTHSTAPAALAGLDLEMPGPPAWLGPNLAAAVRAGEVDEAVVDADAANLLRLMARVGLLAGDAGDVEEQEDDDPGRRALARRVATDGTVLLVNDGLLPLNPQIAERRGDRSERPANGHGRRELGGNAPPSTQPDRGVVGTAAAGDGDLRGGLPHRPRHAPHRPPTGIAHERGERGVHGRVLRRAGAALRWEGASRHRRDPFRGAVWIGPPTGLETGQWSARLSGTFTPDTSGLWRLGLESAGRSVLRLDGEVVLDNSDPKRGTGFYGAGSEPIEVTRELEAGRPYALTVDLWGRVRVRTRSWARS